MNRRYFAWLPCCLIPLAVLSCCYPVALGQDDASWPKEIVADVIAPEGAGLQIRFESRSFWTLYRIDYRGTRLCLDRFGSHYGSVANRATSNARASREVPGRGGRCGFPARSAAILRCRRTILSRQPTRRGRTA